MKDKKDIQNIRALLERYYEAETTREEEKELETFFTECDPKDIPEEMTADMKLFKWLETALPSSVELEATNELMTKIEEILSKPVVTPVIEKRKFWPKILRRAGIAVAACIACVIIVKVAGTGVTQPDSTDGLTAEAYINNDNDLPTLTIIRSNYEGVLAEPEDYFGKEEKPLHKKAVPKARKTVVTEDDGFIEITDPEEARRITMEIGRLLAQNVESTGDAVAQIGNSINSYKEIYNTILQ